MNNLSTRRTAWRYLGFALGGFVLLALVFGAGFFLGRGSVRPWRGGTPLPAQNSLLLNGHGAVGEIIQIEKDQLIVQARDGTTQTVIVTKETRVERGLQQKGAKLVLPDLKVGNYILVIGAPNAEGQINAKLIRVIEHPALTPTPSGL